MNETRNLLAKTFCWQRQTRWDRQDGLAPLIRPADLKVLRERCLHRPLTELQQAAQDLGIDLATLQQHNEA